MDIENYLDKILRKKNPGVYTNVENQETQDKVFKDTTSKLSEHFTDFVVIARRGRGGLFWYQTDASWALGAMHRMTNEIDFTDSGGGDGDG